MNVTDPLGVTTEHKLIATSDGYYENYLWFDSRMSETGEYTVQIKYRDIATSTILFNVDRPQAIETTARELLAMMHKEPEIVKEKVPVWIKNNAKWWAADLIDDDTFTQGIQHLVKEKIINIKDLPSASGPSESKIPSWIKNNAKWWADGLLTEDDFLNGLKYMVEKGIIRVN